MLGLQCIAIINSMLAVMFSSLYSYLEELASVYCCWNAVCSLFSKDTVATN